MVECSFNRTLNRKTITDKYNMVSLIEAKFKGYICVIP